MMHIDRVGKNVLRFSGAIWLLVGLAHALEVLRLSEVLSQHSTLPESQKDQIVFNWGVSGIVISVLGFILLLISSELWKGSRSAHRIAATIGVFFFLAGFGAYMTVPNLTAPLIFSLPALLVLTALIISRKQFSSG